MRMRGRPAGCHANALLAAEGAYRQGAADAAQAARRAMPDAGPGAFSHVSNLRAGPCHACRSGSGVVAWRRPVGAASAAWALRTVPSGRPSPPPSTAPAQQPCWTLWNTTVLNMSASERHAPASQATCRNAVHTPGRAQRGQAGRLRPRRGPHRRRRPGARRASTRRCTWPRGASAKRPPPSGAAGGRRRRPRGPAPARPQRLSTWSASSRQFLARVACLAQLDWSAWTLMSRL